MAIIKSAKKAHRRSLRRRVFNVRRQNALHDAVKAVRKAGNAANAALLSSAFQAIDKAAKNNVISPNAAARKKSRLAALLRRPVK